MALNSGAKLGPYEILSPLGAGGMGEVYRARDTRLDRTVAIKVLSSQLVANVTIVASLARIRPKLLKSCFPVTILRLRRAVRYEEPAIPFLEAQNAQRRNPYRR
jgi:serine/threonine protein kinase